MPSSWLYWSSFSFSCKRMTPTESSHLKKLSPSLYKKKAIEKTFEKFYFSSTRMWPKNSVIVFTLSLPYAGNLFIADTLSFRYVSNILFVDETMIWKVLTIQPNEQFRKFPTEGMVRSFTKIPTEKLRQVARKGGAYMNFFLVLPSARFFFSYFSCAGKFVLLSPSPNPLKN